MRIPTDIDELCPFWLDEAIGKRNRYVVFSPKRVGADHGLAGMTYRIDVVRALARSTSFAVKLCDARTASHEGRVYSDLLPATEVPVPRFLSAKDDGENGYVLLEYVRDATQGDVLEGCSREVAELLIRALATLHSRWWEGHDELPEWIADRSTSATASLSGERVERCLERHGDVLDDAGRGAIQGLPEALPAVRGELAAHPVTLVHGDLHMDNVMLDATGRPRILDWASASRGHGTSDVARVLTECLLPDQRRAFGEDLVALYCDELSGQGVTGYGRPEVDRGLWLSLQLLLAGAVRWAGAPEAPAPDSRQVRLQRNLLRNVLGALAG